MPTITIAMDGMVLKDIALTRPRTTLGRRTYNDIVIDQLGVSGEHAVFVLHADGVELLDLHSTNGTYVNGKAITSVRLQADDLIEIGPYQIQLKPAAQASIRVLDGPAAGREIALTKPVTTLGKPGIAVAAISRQSTGYVLTMVDGKQFPALNGVVIGNEPIALQDQDRLELAGTQMLFLLP